MFVECSLASLTQYFIINLCPKTAFGWVNSHNDATLIDFFFEHFGSLKLMKPMKETSIEVLRLSSFYKKNNGMDQKKGFNAKVEFSRVYNSNDDTKNHFSHPFGNTDDRISEHRPRKHSLSHRKPLLLCCRNFWVGCDFTNNRVIRRGWKDL